MQPAMTLPFAREEYARRLLAVRTAMADRGIELLLLSDPCNVYYLSGYDGWSFYTPQLLLVGLDGPPVWFGRAMDAIGVKLTSILSEGETVCYSDTLVQNALAHPFSELPDAIGSRFGKVGAIGLEKQSFYLTASGSEAIAQALPDATIRDASLLVNWIRFRKSEAELVLMREAATLAELAMAAARDTARPGVRESEVAGRIYAASVGGSGGIGGVYSSSPPFLAAAERLGSPHLPWTDRLLAEGDQLNFELMGNRRRYQLTIGRTHVIGHAEPALGDLHAMMCDIIDAVIDGIRPGATCGSIADHLGRLLAERGLSKSSRCGYSLGIAYPPTGGEQTASLRPGDMTILEPGCTVHFLPALWERNHSLVMSEALEITERGARRLCDIPRHLVLKD